MSGTERRSPRALALVVLCLAVISVPLQARAGPGVPPDETIETAGSTTTSVEPESTRETSGTEGTDPDRADDPAPVAEDDPPLTWIVAVLAVVIVGITVWWMLRRTQDEAVGPPDDDWPSDSLAR